MISALKAEFRKLLSVRSTYILAGLSFAIVIGYSFYIIGFRTGAVVDPHTHLLHVPDPQFLSAQVGDALQAVMTLGAIVAVLLMAHEYRYNTIMYTLTAANSRTKVLIAKLLASVSFGMFFALVVGTLSPLMAALGLRAHHVQVVPQTFHFGTLLWRSVFYGGSYAAAAMLLGLLFRNVVAVIVTLFLFPGAVEQLIGLALGHNKIYLPFTALDSVISATHDGGQAVHPLSPGRGALVFLAYLVIGWSIGWILFLRRDAN